MKDFFSLGRHCFRSSMVCKTGVEAVLHTIQSVARSLALLYFPQRVPSLQNNFTQNTYFSILDCVGHIFLHEQDYTNWICFTESNPKKKLTWTQATFGQCPHSSSFLVPLKLRENKVFHKTLFPPHNLRMLSSSWVNL